MTKIVINACHGGFGLSEKAMRRYAERKGITLYSEPSGIMSFMTYYTVPPEQRTPELPNFFSQPIEARKANNEAMKAERLSDDDIPRDDPDLVSVVEELGSDAASDRFAELRVVEIPGDVEWQIEEYDGHEWVAEKHRTWP